MNRINLVLPSAGMGSRFRVVGESRPKPLIPVLGMPMIMWVLLNFPLSPSDRVFVISQIQDRLPIVLEAFTKQLPFDLKFIEINGFTEGPASTVSLAFDEIDDDEALIVANTDQYVFADLEPFLQKVRNASSDGQILTMKASSNAWSYVGRDSSGNISEIVEKVEISSEATVGIYGWSKASFAKLSFRNSFDEDIRTNNEFYVAPTYNFLIKQGYEIETVMIGKHGKAVHGLGIPSDLNRFIANERAGKISLRYKTQFKIKNDE